MNASLKSQSAPRIDGTVLVAGASAHVTGRLAFSGTGLSLWGGVDPTNGEIIDARHLLHGRVVKHLGKQALAHFAVVNLVGFQGTFS